MLPEIAHMLAVCVNHIAVLRVPLLAAELLDVSTLEARRDLFAARVQIQRERWVKAVAPNLPNKVTNFN
jgi:hypothetical protein